MEAELAFGLSVVPGLPDWRSEVSVTEKQKLKSGFVLFGYLQLVSKITQKRASDDFQVQI